MRILDISDKSDIKSVMEHIRVDKYGIGIMVPKAVTHLVKLDAISNIAANILKQEMLSLGGDAAIAKDALTGKAKATDCLLMGNIAQLARLNAKLNIQPFGLHKFAKDLKEALRNYEKKKFSVTMGSHVVRFGAGTRIMGIMNLTPDSFSNDGLYSHESKLDPGVILHYALRLAQEGADIIDIGGESTRPGSRPVSVKEELFRVIPAIKILAKKIKVPLSIDTYKPQVALRALDAGAVMVNDITALKDTAMARIVSRYHAAVVLMHMRGNPRTMQKNPHYASLIDEIIAYLSVAIGRAREGGISNEKIIVDPGIGFGKSLADNLEIIKRLKEFKILGRPILVGPSRKSFIGKLLHNKPHERLLGTLAASILAAGNGAHMLRVHDVKEAAGVLKVTDAIRQGAQRCS